MAHITTFNLKRIVYSGEILKLNLLGEIYRIPFEFFSKYEKNALLSIQEILKNPEKYFDMIYIPFKAVDTYKLMYEGKQPAYHQNVDCPRLKSDYENFEIFSEIRERGPVLVKEFRDWFETVKYLLDEEQTIDAFIIRMKARWNIDVNLNAVRIRNSGYSTQYNPSSEELEVMIEKLIIESGHYVEQSDKIRLIIMDSLKNTFSDNNWGSRYSYSETKNIRDFAEEFGIKTFKLIRSSNSLKHYFKTDTDISGKVTSEVVEIGVLSWEMKISKCFDRNISDSEPFYLLHTSEDKDVFPNKIFYSSEEKQQVLKYFDETFKIPLKKYLIDYYRLTLNPEIKIDDYLLDSIGLVPCKYCHGPDYEIDLTKLS